jgi:hypothetical protein
VNNPVALAEWSRWRTGDHLHHRPAGEVEHATGEQGRFEAWVEAIDRSFQQQDRRGTPGALLDGRPVDPGSLFDPAALASLLRS